MRVTARVNIELAKPANYIPMGFWVQPVAGDPKKPFYRITDLGIPMVKVSDGTALGYSVYVLQVDVSNNVIPSANNPQWRLVESTELIYIQQAFIERLWAQMLVAEGAEIGGFEIKNGLLQSKAKNSNGNSLIKLNGLTGQAEITGSFSSNNSGNKIVIDPQSRGIKLIDASGKEVADFSFISDLPGLEIRKHASGRVDEDIYLGAKFLESAGLYLSKYSSQYDNNVIGVKMLADGTMLNVYLADMTDAQANSSSSIAYGQFYRTGKVVKIKL